MATILSRGSTFPSNRMSRPRPVEQGHRIVKLSRLKLMSIGTP
uniref:Uncharacterized protein n=1 Tax=Lepeophtheirus salmonis TaxID=72036 RepID=A0A0K2TAC9_LEPSM